MTIAQTWDGLGPAENNSCLHNKDGCNVNLRFDYNGTVCCDVVQVDDEKNT